MAFRIQSGIYLLNNPNGKDLSGTTGDSKEPYHNYSMKVAHEIQDIYWYFILSITDVKHSLVGFELFMNESHIKEKYSMSEHCLNSATQKKLIKKLENIGFIFKKDLT